MSKDLDLIPSNENNNNNNKKIEKEQVYFLLHKFVIKYFFYISNI